ncbi:12821_t:CDS:2, partial [Rhizophagus irregularis]
MSKFASKLSTRHRTRRTLDVNEDQPPIWWLVYDFMSTNMLCEVILIYQLCQGVFRRINCPFGGWFMSTKHCFCEVILDMPAKESSAGSTAYLVVEKELSVPLLLKMYDDMVSEAPGSRNAFGHNIVNICIQNGYYDPESISIRGIYKK